MKDKFIPADSEPLSNEQIAELAALAKLPDADIDLSDAPEVRDWAGARRGAFYRPVKQLLTLRLDADVVAWFKSGAEGGEGYQTRINRALRAFMDAQPNRPTPQV